MKKTNFSYLIARIVIITFCCQPLYSQIVSDSIKKYDKIILQKATVEYPEKVKNVSYKSRDYNTAFNMNSLALDTKQQSDLDEKLYLGSESYFFTRPPFERKQMADLALKYIIYEVYVNKLIDFLKLKNCNLPESDIEFGVEKIDNYKTAFFLYENFKKIIDDFSSTEIPDDIYLNGLKRNLEIVKKHMNYLLEKNFVFYRYTETSKQFLKSVNVFHDNDIFMFSKRNEDRDYTGGFRLEFTTDFFKMRLLKPLNNGKILSYQSLFIGGEGYTPFIRYTKDELENYIRDNFKEPRPKISINANTGFLSDSSKQLVRQYLTSKQKNDRPFASFQYISRAKYRINYNGQWRSKSYFKIGVIGGDLGRRLQAVIHQDLDTKAIKVLNWENQIGNGGRLAINVDHNIDLMLFSSESTIGKKDKYLSKPKEQQKNRWLNIYLPIEIHFGTELTAWGGGLGFSTKNFKERSGTNDLRIDNNVNQSICKRFWNNFFFSTELRYRNVIHNSMLEGVGILNTFDEDPFDDEAPSVYKLRKHEVIRDLWIHETNFGFRFNKISLYYSRTMNLNKEFQRMLINSPNPNSAGKSYYGWGRVGFNFFL